MLTGWQQPEQLAARLTELTSQGQQLLAAISVYSFEMLPPVCLEYKFDENVCFFLKIKASYFESSLFHHFPSLIRDLQAIALLSTMPAFLWMDHFLLLLSVDHFCPSVSVCTVWTRGKLSRTVTGQNVPDSPASSRTGLGSLWGHGLWLEIQSVFSLLYACM